MPDDVRLVKTLLDIPLFEDLDYTQVQEVLKISQQKAMAPGQVLCEPRTIDEALIVLLSGRLRLETAAGELLDYQTPVRVIGEMGVFTGQIRSTRVVVDEASDVLVIDAHALDEMLEEDPQMGNHLLANLIKLLYGRLYDVNQEVERLRDTAKQLKERVQELSPGDPLLAELFPEDAENA
jgi:CRP-like cAMP-binding protein